MQAFPMTGFLGTGAPFAADVNLVVQIVMAGALLLGAVLARRKRYEAHGLCQTAVMALNLVMIGVVMWPSFQQQVVPSLARGVGRSYYRTAEIHAVLGTGAEFLGLYIVMVARTRILPERLRFRNWKRWMRFELGLWWLVTVSGFATYWRWYIAPFR